MLYIDDGILLERASNYNSYIKGEQYFYDGRVSNVRYDKRSGYVEGIVRGTENYKVNVIFDKYGRLKFSDCTCSAFEKYPGDCKHVIAFLHFIMNSNLSQIFEENDEKNMVDNIINYYRLFDEQNTRYVNIEVNYEFDPNEIDEINNGSFLHLRMGENKLYVVKSIRRFFESLDNREEIKFGKSFTFIPGVHEFKEEDKQLMNFLRLLYENHKVSYSRYGYEKSIFDGKRVRLTPAALKSFFKLMEGKKFNGEIAGKTYKDMKITKEDLPLAISLKEENSNLVLKMDFDNDIIPLVDTGEYFFQGGQIYRPSEEQATKFAPFYNQTITMNNSSLRIANEQKESFISEVLPNLKDVVDLNIDERVKKSIYNPDLKTEVYLDKRGDLVVGKVNFVYDNIVINPFSSQENSYNNNKKILLRDIHGERKVLKILEESAFKVRDGEIYIDEDEKIFDFIYETIPELQDFCEIYYSETFKNVTFKNPSYFSGGIALNDEMDMLDFSFEIEGIDTSELANIFGALKERKRYYKLKDGSFLPLDNSELEYVGNILEYLNVTENELSEGTVAIPKYRANYLDNYIREKQLNFIKENKSFKKLVQDINDPEDIDYKIPEELEGVLRDYQKVGFKWLKTLSRYGLGGILADDMGLGKTLQIIALLLSDKEEKGSYPSLVVAPTSLLYNWEEEVEKFAPTLKTLIVAGSREDREALIKSIGDCDIVITSYPLIRRDILLYEDMNFRYCVLDEAQHIKNAKSINAKSVKKIKAKNYLALTGTPMENSLMELWSIFDYLMPGYLLSSRKFLETYEKPILKEKDEEALKDLNRHIKPFILRRLKRDVLKELPDKIEQKIVVELTNEQKKVYLAYLQAIKGEIEEEINSFGFNRSQIKILAGLTRLRQICCHPGMFIENYSGGSGKIDSLEEILKDALEGGHRILLFSQFTSALNIIREMLEKNHVEYMYLDGSTNVLDRGKMVKDFNGGKGDVFLISLKAGGTGLNLTGADMVIHFDPWWNPAVEDQATDRAYRIGQKNTVQVIKLITKGTIEEKIFKLQEKKKEMIDKVITEGETLVSKLSEDEIKYLFDME